MKLSAWLRGPVLSNDWFVRLVTWWALAVLLGFTAIREVRATVPSPTTWSQIVLSANPQVVTVPFVFQNSTDLLVLDSKASPPVVLTLNSDYTVSGGAGSTGTITTIVGGAHGVQIGDKITIARSVPLTQTTAYSNSGPLTAAMIGASFDKLTMITQQLNLVGANSLQFQGDEAISGVLPLNSRKNKLLGFDSNGAVQFYTPGGGGGGGSGTVTSVAATVPAFLSVTGSPITTSGTLAFTLSGTPLPVANGGTGSTSPALVAGSNVTITGSWPNQIINSTGAGSGTVSSGTANQLTYYGSTGTTVSGFSGSSLTSSGLSLSLADTTATFLTLINSSSGGGTWYLRSRGSGGSAGTFDIGQTSSPASDGYFKISAAGLLKLASYTTPGVLTVDSSGNVTSTPATGTGTVTSVSVTTANGVSGAVATPTSTPAITLTLGDITPSSVNLPAGSAGAPKLYFSTDVTTGLFRPGANQIGFSVSASTLALITSTGIQAAIGQTTPQVGTFSLLGVGANPQSILGVNLQPVVSGPGQIYGVLEGPSMTATQNGGSFYSDVQAANTTWAKGTFTGHTGYMKYIANPSVTGSGTIDNQYQLYIETPTRGTTNYSIYSAGGDNTLVGGITLGLAGTTAGTIKLKNATSGTITVQPVTGALGTPTILVPATTGTLLNSTGSFTTGNLVATDSSGRAVDSGSVALNGVTSSAGAGDSGKVPLLNGSGVLDNSFYSTVPVAKGGTGQTSLTANTVILGNGTSAVAFVAPSTSGNILTSNGTTWTSAAAPSGTLPSQTGNSGKFLTTDGSSASWATVTGGTGDMLSTLTAAEISITGATTGTISRMHVCSGTSANYTVTLPAVSGNTGKFIGFRMSPSLTKLVTLDGNGSETIDGALTRVLWANEVAILFCDGTAWTKVAGKTIPMRCYVNQGGSTQSIPSASLTKTNVNNTSLDNTGLMADNGNSRISIVRDGTYIASGAITFNGINAAGNIQLQLNPSAGTAVSAVTNNTFAAAFTSPKPFGFTVLAAGAYIEEYAYQDSGLSVSSYPGADSMGLRVDEQPSW